MKPSWLALPLIAIPAGMVSLYLYAHTLPSLAFPLSSIDALVFTDGGSLTVELEDAEGDRFYFGIKGDLATSREMSPSFYARTLLGVPLAVTPDIGGAEEYKLASFARNLAEVHLPPTSLSKVKNNDLDGLSEAELKYAVVYSVYRTLGERSPIQLSHSPGLD